MKNKWLVNGLLAMVIAIGTVCLANTNDYAVLATEGTVEAATPEGVDYVVEKHTNISEYRTGSYTAPSIEETTVTGEWVFAGWFKNVECTSALGSAEQLVTGTPYYAKFVSADVLSVKCQISTGTTEGSDSTLLRCISSVDSLKYSKIGFDLVIVDAETKTVSATKNMEGSSVGKRIRVTADKAENPCNYSPKVVDTESEYFYSAVEKIDAGSFANGYVVKPYWVTKDGTKVYGVSRYVTVNEGINKNVIHIPVKMDQTTADATTEVIVGDSTAAKVDYDADGGYAHFALSVNTSALSSVTKYTVTAGNSTSTYIYRNLNTEYTGSSSIDTSWYSSDSPDDEFVIATSADLYGLASIVNGGDHLQTADSKQKTIYVVSDITVNEGTPEGDEGTTEDDWATKAPSYSWTTIGNSKSKSYYFGGIFDGQRHTIKGLYGKTYGLFGYVSGATIKNFRLEDSYFNSGSGVGSIAFTFDGTMENVYSNAILQTSNSASGGLVGRLTNEGLGGKESSASEATISNCWYAGKINVAFEGTTNMWSGGIVGQISQGTAHAISNCLYTGTINIDNACTGTSKYTAVGGILGGATSGSYECTVADCFSAGTANVTVPEGNTKQSGSIAGYNNVTIQEGSVVYAITTWNDNTDVAQKIVEGSVPAGTITNYESYQNMLGLDYYTSSNKTGHWVVRESGIPVLKNFADEWIDVAWYFDTDNYNQGGHTFDISTKEELYGLSTISQEYTFARDTINLTSDITVNYGKAADWAEGNYTDELRNWTPIGWINGGSTTVDQDNSHAFAGTFDGNGHTIQGIYTNTGKTCAGFIGRLSGTVQNLKLQNSAIVSPTGSDAKHTGGVVGVALGDSAMIDSVYCDAEVKNKRHTSGNYTGGIVGAVLKDGHQVTINNCWFAGSVEGRSVGVGGIMGLVSAGKAYITDCLVTGTVTNVNENINSSSSATAMYVGGILGGDSKGHWTVTRCLMNGTMELAENATTGIASIVGFASSTTSTKTRELQDCYTTIPKSVYTYADQALDLTEGKNAVTGSDTCESITTVSKETVSKLFVEGSAWTTAEDGSVILQCGK